jgi:hypothetical protein
VIGERSARTRTVDWLHDLGRFALRFPAWTGADGYPLTWRHYVYGMAAIERENAAAKMRMADAVAAHKAGQRDWKRWVREHSAISGA